jgi:hypothetical protein
MARTALAAHACPGRWGVADRIVGAGRRQRFGGEQPGDRLEAEGLVGVEQEDPGDHGGRDRLGIEAMQADAGGCLLGVRMRSRLSEPVAVRRASAEPPARGRVGGHRGPDPVADAVALGLGQTAEETHEQVVGFGLRIDPTTVPDAPPSPSYVGFETPSDGVVIAANGLYLTDDSGATWAMARGAGPVTCSQEAVQGGTFAVCSGSGRVGTKVTVSSDTNCGAPGDGEPSLEFLGPEAYIGSGGGGDNVAISRAGVGFTATFVIPSTYHGGEQTGHGMQTLAVPPGDEYSFATYPAGGCRVPFTVTG